MKTIAKQLRQNRSKILALCEKRSAVKNKIERQVLWAKVERLLKEQDQLIERQVDEEIKIKKAKQQKIVLKIQAVEKRLDELYDEVKALDSVKDYAKRKSLLAKIERLEHRDEAKLMQRYFESGRLLKPDVVAKAKASSEKLLKELQAIKKRKGGR